MTKKPWLLGAACALALLGHGAAQEASEGAPQEGTRNQNTESRNEEGQSDDDQDPEDVITITRGIRRDRAMQAFMAGDYETAEVEFKKNLQCAERVELLDDFAVEQATAAALSAEVRQSAPAVSPGGEGGGAGSTPSTAVPQGSGTPARPRDIPERTCESPEWQLYMIAMSQLKLGRLDEAKEAFYRVIALSRDEIFFDAHYRIGLLELMEGNLDAAQKRLDHLNVLVRRCQRRGERCEIRPELEEATAFLEVKLAEARARAESGE